MEAGRGSSRVRKAMSQPDTVSKNSSGFGLFLITIGTFALWQSRDIALIGLGGNHDPGPRAFPIGLSLILVVGGIVQVALALFARRIKGSSHGQPLLPPLWKPRRILTDRGTQNVALVIVGVIVYVLAIEWIGFALSTLLFGSGMMVRLGTRWWQAIAMTLLLIVIIELLFTLLLEVQLPTGQFGLPY